MKNFKNTIDDLHRILGQGHLKTDPASLAEYVVEGMIPQAIVYPRDPEEIAEIVKLANRENLAVIPWGSGSKVAAGNPPSRLDLVICTSRLDAITDMDISNLTVTAEAGVRLKDLQLRLASEEGRCFLPIDPPFVDRTTMGGLIATNSSGPRRLLYGLPRDMVLGVRFVAPNGEIVRAGGKTVKNVSGYDVSKLMIGSWGTLGILCEMTLRLMPLPERMETLLFPFDAFANASAFVENLFESKLLPAAVEVMNSLVLRELGFDGSASAGSGGYVVGVAIEGFRESVARMAREMKEMALNAGARGDTLLQEERHRAFWLAFSNMASSLVNRFGTLITAQLNYPISEWKEIVPYVDATLAKNDIEHTILAHAGSGVSLINLHIEQEGQTEMGEALQALQALSEYLIQAEGSLVVQKAPSGLKGQLPVWGPERPDYLIMKRIKKQLDPLQVMCPGRFVV
ncbi:MAG: FAD-binding oxidoreductase [Pseudomonadota bacterium]